MKKKIIIIAFGLLIIVLVVLFLGKFNKIKNIETPNGDNTQIVGGDRDAHGCIGSAGYSWCEVKNKCLRIWEEKCEVAPAPVEDKKISCEQKGGEWFTDNNVCEINSLSKDACIAQGGEFNECASACRHDPTAGACTMQCVLTCTFK